MTPKQCLDYEIGASWWACRVRWKPLQILAAKYFTWKVRRKYRRWFDGRFDEAYKQLMGEKT
jgi:hypothetical protein